MQANSISFSFNVLEHLNVGLNALLNLNLTQFCHKRNIFVKFCNNILWQKFVNINLIIFSAPFEGKEEAFDKSRYKAFLDITFQNLPLI